MEWYLSVALILIVAGGVMLVAEFFVPTGGFAAVLGIACFAVAVAVILFYGSGKEAAVATIGLSIGSMVAWYFMVQAWRKLMPSPAEHSEAAAATVNETPEIAGLEKLRGRYGKTLSPMRPSGSVLIDGHRVDALTEGMMLDENTWVKCVDVKGGRVLVRKVDPPGDLSNIDLEDLN
jgi:membrane-bound serine protease (ClpP class)